jgi:hypothetical protein
MFVPKRKDALREGSGSWWSWKQGHLNGASSGKKRNMKVCSS